MKITRLFVLLFLFFVCQSIFAQTKQTEQQRVERLVDLGKVWGAVKYFHPYLAYRQIDWDNALIQAIPKIDAAKTQQQYEAAINSMLNALGDKNTHAEINHETKISELPKTGMKDFIRLEKGIFFVDAEQAAKMREQDEDKYGEILEKNMPLLEYAKAIVIDGRGTGEYGENLSYNFEEFLHQTLVQIIDTNIPLGSYRYRMHNGYAPQSGSGNSGYYSALVNTAPEVLAGQNKAKTLPTIFLINKKTHVTAPMLSGLQAAGKIFIVREDDSSPQETGVKTFEIKLPDNLSVKIRSAELVNPNDSIGFEPDEIITTINGEDAAVKEALRIIGGKKTTRTRKQIVAAKQSRQIPQIDKTYPEMEFPNSEHRLLALFRFWNVINYFYPYKNLIGESWENILPRYIPKFEAAHDAVQYQATVREMVAEIHDSHGFITGTNQFDEKIGKFIPPLKINYIEKQTVVEKVLDEKIGVKPGDIILKIDGEPVETRRQYFEKLYAASTPQALNLRICFEILRGQKNSKVKLTLHGADDQIREIEIARTLGRRDPSFFAAFYRTTPVMEVLPSGFGYVDLARLQLAEVDKMFETIKNAPAVIFDMRGYPNGTAWEIVQRLTTRKNTAGAIFSNPIIEAAGLSDNELRDINFGFTQYLPEPKGDIYKGKVVMLINEEAISQAEHTCLFFESATDVTFIGTPTTGANGDVTNVVLPGNIVVNFSGHGIRHADGRQLQRIGIQPTINVAPTIKGIIEGRDEILNAAVKFLQSGKI